MTRFVTREKERERKRARSPLFNCSVIRASLRLIPGYGLHKEFFFTEPEKRRRRRRGRRKRWGCRSLGNEERERVLVSRFVPVVRFFAFSDQTAKPRLIRPGSSFSFLSTSLLFSPGFLHHLRINWISFSRRCAGPGPTCSIKSLGKMS